jgi:hypothetical protein
LGSIEKSIKGINIQHKKKEGLLVERRPAFKEAEEEDRNPEIIY